MHTKTVKLQIVKPFNDDWKNVNGIFKEVRKETRYVLNKTIQLSWEYQNFSSEYKKEHGIYPKSKDILNYKSMDGYVYDRLKSDIVCMNKGNLNQTIRRATKKWKSDAKEILRGDRSIPSYKKDIPFEIAKSNIKKIKKVGNNYIVVISLINKSFSKEKDRMNGVFELVVKRGNNSQKTILDRLINGDYIFSTSQIIQRKNKWFLNLTYRFEGIKRELDENKIMGIDFGIVHPVYMAINEGWERDHIKSDQIIRFRKQMEKRKKELGKQTRYAGKSRVGHGIKKRTEPLNNFRHKVAQFRNTKNHIFSRFVVDTAVRWKCATIQMEDLKDIHKDNVFLKNWTYYDLQEKIMYKAEQEGIRVIKIDPKYTSQRCSRCGIIDKNNRLEQEKFHCRNCDYQKNADYNAARNIATKDIEKIIQEQMDIQNKSKKQLAFMLD